MKRQEMIQKLVSRIKLHEKIEPNPKAPKFKFNDGVRTTNYRNIFSKGYTENWSR